MMFPQVKVNVRQFLTRREENPVPMRTMVGYIEKETPKAIFVHLHGQPEPSSTCLHCGRTLTHPVSLEYGIGPICGQHFHIPNVSMETVMEHYEEIRQRLAGVKWSGWLPKSKIEVTATGEYETIETTKWEIKFIYQGKVYKKTTTDKAEVEKIKANAEKFQITPVA